MYFRFNPDDGFGRLVDVSLRGSEAFDTEQFPRLRWSSSLEIRENMVAIRRGPGRAEVYTAPSVRNSVRI